MGKLQTKEIDELAEKLILDSIPCKPANISPEYLKQHIKRYVDPSKIEIYYYDDKPFLILWPLHFLKDGNSLKTSRSYRVLNEETTEHQQKNPDFILPMPTHCIYSWKENKQARLIGE